MNKTYIIILAIIVLIVCIFIYIKIATNKSPSIMWWWYDDKMKNKIISELSKKVSESNTEYSFDIKNCNEIIVQSYIHANDDTPEKELLINDKNTIDEITNNLNKLPKDGEMYISFAPTISYLKIIFYCENNKNYMVSYYWEKIKTPWTTFYAEEKEDSKKIFDIIKKLINK